MGRPFRVLLGLLLLAGRPALAATTLDDTTKCPGAFKAFDTKDPSAMRSVIQFVENTMDILDERHTEKGEPGIMNQLSDDGLIHLAIMAVEHCRLYPQSTIYNASAFVYRGTRDIELQFGAAK